jgi:K+-transporting ATPase c subunit
MGASSMLATGGDFSPLMLSVMTVVMGIIYGFVIELFTTVVFKAKA